jgi:hypothetical protein
MSTLEASVTPWILSVQTKADLARFQEDDRRLTFARWALKTACVLDQVGGMGEIGPEIPERLFKQQNSLPDNVHVLIAFHDWPDSTLFAFNQRNRWTKYPLHVQCPEPDCDSDGRFFKVAFAINRLMVLVVGVPSPHFHLVIGTGVHVPIWPERTIQLHHWFYTLRTEGVDPHEALRNFSDLVAAAHAGRMVEHA